MRTKRAFVPKRELIDEFHGLDMRTLTSLLHNAQRTATINASKYELEWDLLLPGRSLIGPSVSSRKAKRSGSFGIRFTMPWTACMIQLGGYERA